MKLLKFFLLALLIISCATTRTLNSRVYIDENQNLIPEGDFLERWRDVRNNFARWDYQDDTARVAELSHPIFEQYVLDYPAFLDNIEKMTGKKISDSTIILLEYVFLNDLCSSDRTNTWSKADLRKRKNFLDPIKKKIEEEDENLLFLHFFEEGIKISNNNPASETEYFYQDTESFLRNTIFRNPTLCGSFALVKPRGQVLVRNGEFRLDWMAEYLDEEFWSKIFPSKIQQ